MARVAAQLTNFTAGELSPRLDGRNDLAKYSAGCATVENMVIYPHGAAARPPALPGAGLDAAAPGRDHEAPRHAHR